MCYEFIYTDISVCFECMILEWYSVGTRLMGSHGPGLCVKWPRDYDGGGWIGRVYERE